MELAAIQENCPDTSHMKLRAKIKCPKDLQRYHCLRTGSMPDRVNEICKPRRILQKGIKINYDDIFCFTLLKNLQKGNRRH